MKKEILKMFKEANGEFVSGENLSQALNCSRTAIWKHIEELREEGYEFEAVRRSGYRLLSIPDVPYPAEVKEGLQTTSLGQEVHFFPTIDSTQHKAHGLAKEGAKEGTVVIADEQVGGKGRLGRVWHSPPGTGIALSILLRPQLELHRCPQLTLLAAVAIVEAIQEETNLPAQIKWPNDVLLNGKKICGILTELNAESDRINYLIIGIGINVNTPSFPEEIGQIATSLMLEKQAPIRRVKLVQNFLEKLERLYQLYLTEGFAPIKRRWESHAISIGKRVIIRQISGMMTGLALGIDDDGVLLVQKDDGNIEKVYSADIELG
ncbi:biotin--[acetyl-CoA-carboxylase] ligase [Ammoniphilus sp. CFH 90114]|uniref:biotin--[acetyl-CoA-carboxylase] ligase n=1 Tax=Ammoniphilus sp. CFH 90114 TaxID=2493665 RepID=UPI00100DDD04|nr:biotin--[acetyl-CoA-carboxylase] ligase [Ammoniphilus sp. CFH 90114]RXT13943.1 biotin--[acetyl-CoA-carboxylase] ligase [Ammoniphilus sp. CFH 90114]